MKQLVTYFYLLALRKSIKQYQYEMQNEMNQY